MCNASSDKTNTVPGSGEALPPESRLDASQTNPKPGTSSGRGAPSRPGYSRHSSTSSSTFPNPNQARYGPPSPLNMSHMAYSLPTHQSPSSPFEVQHLMHQYSTTHPHVLPYPMQSMSHYPGQNTGGNMPFAAPYPPAYIPYPMPQPPPTQHATGHYQQYVLSPTMQLAPGQVSPFGAGYYHPAGYIPFSRHGSQSESVQLRNPGMPSRQASFSQAVPAPGVTTGTPRTDTDKRGSKGDYDVTKTIVDGSNTKRPSQPVTTTSDSQHAYQPLIPPPGTPRGPPRKPKQSGHALWVGNLPPGASVVDLKDHFSQDAVDSIESVFLISKSNCAFVNYKSAAACAAALARFHDSRFQGVRLVCRLRKGFTAPGSGLGSGAVGVGMGSSGGVSHSRPGDLPGSFAGVETGPLPNPSNSGHQRGGEPPRMPERYFIVKSLTVEDLELSKHSGIWATQTHNEVTLNHAFANTDNVYLVFSANKSGEYFGYARMKSPINDDEDLTMEMPPRPEPQLGMADDFEVIVTAATPIAPRGRIIDDPARGTIFWEVESSEDEHDAGPSNDSKVEGPGAGLDTPPPPSPSLPPQPAPVFTSEAATGGMTGDEEEIQTFGKPFRIQWLSTDRVPFHRTRGLRNPWNANREVKIARDGTEIEPTVGRKLISLFYSS
ncbi:Uncharacterized protein PECH_006791 [Penicillium ucsense]|uniref:YTH domain-containing protein n=1 Tax=Penicillium ucsense TaxID=2839758 RepID=A0A8J8VVR7_9EURO|nr:Uncharacterized protein PECM_003542 [Penicillium ucsense]KAF7735278.1 Uncharacterized protein PECH_006791 [Penicillium ucsense]